MPGSDYSNVTCVFPSSMLKNVEVTCNLHKIQLRVHFRMWNVSLDIRFPDKRFKKILQQHTVRF